ncbi:hypothetical protein BVX94_03110 [bacterium B17]|nr:hypothetical protein BVX94_03110 [bacterium B17]
MMNKFEVVCCLGLGDAQVYNHLMPIANHPMVSKLWIVRTRKSETGEIPNSEYVLIPDVWKPLRLLNMLKQCRRLARRREVGAFVSFNPFPYGLISSMAASRSGKPVHFGLIGSDWYRDAKSGVGGFARKRLSKGSFFTVTGKGMREEMIADGFDGDKIRVLPHSIDLDAYPLADPAKSDYAAIYVGKLIKLKRVDTIIQAFERVVAAHPDAKLCIVGRGPLEGELKSLAISLGLEKNIDFVGYQNNVQPYLSRAKVNIIASSREGFPFSLVEGICSGVIPIATPVGTIPDKIQDDENGLIFPHDDSAALASCILRLLDEPDTCKRIRENVIMMRDEFSYNAAVEIWDSWFNVLA